MPTLSERILHVLLPATCAHCREDLSPGERSPLCPACRERVLPVEVCCLACGVPIDGAAHCFRCRNRTLKGLSVIRAAVQYGPEVQSLVHAFKYRGRRKLARPLAEMLAFALRTRPELDSFRIPAPVPLHPSRLRERGFNQSELLARELGRLAGLGVEAPLARVRLTPPQARIEDRSARVANVRGAFAVRSDNAPVEGKRFLLIDDVGTTGATLEACAVALKEAGAEAVAALVLARQS